MQGIIKRLVKDKGFGFIADSKGTEFFFHQSALKNIKFDELEVGQEVEFEDVDSTKGLRAEDVYV
jgi:cold shock protein